MEKILIVGSGGHAKVIIDILKNSTEYELIGLTDPFPKHERIMGLPILGDDSILPKLFEEGIKYAFIAIGDNQKRIQLAFEIMQMGFGVINAISSHSYVSKSIQLGVGIAIMPGVIINPDAIINDHVIINTGATIDHDCIIETGCHIAPGCNIAGNVRIGKGSLLGIGTKVIPNITIGEWTIVGAGSVVVNNVPSYALAVGFPARVVKRLCEER